MPYLVDTDVFIQAKNFYYGLDFCPAFWDWIIVNNGAGVVFSVEKVAAELEQGNDALKDWASQRGPGFFLKPDAKVVPALVKVSAWASSQNYQPAAVSTFLQAADYYLVAHALAHGFTVVTHEKPELSPKKVKIPNACTGLGIKCVSQYQMLRDEQAKFILGQTIAAAARSA